MYKIFMVVAILVGFSANAQERWRFHEVLESNFATDELPFPTQIWLVRDNDRLILALRLPKQSHSKTYTVIPGTCILSETLQSYSEDDSPAVKYQLRESAKVCEKDQKISVSLSWLKRERRGKWGPLAIGSYKFEPSSNRSTLVFSRTNKEEGSSETEKASAEYLKF